MARIGNSFGSSSSGGSDSSTGSTSEGSDREAVRRLKDRFDSVRTGRDITTEPPPADVDKSRASDREIVETVKDARDGTAAEVNTGDSFSGSPLGAGGVGSQADAGAVSAAKQARAAERSARTSEQADRTAVSRVKRDRARSTGPPTLPPGEVSGSPLNTDRRFSGPIPDRPGPGPRPRSRTRQRSGTGGSLYGTVIEPTGLFVGDLLLEGPDSPEVTDVDERLRRGGDFAFDVAFGGDFAERYSPIGGDDVTVTGPELNIPGLAEGDVTNLITEGDEGDLNEDVAESLLSDRPQGLLDEETEQTLRDRREDIYDTYDVSEEAEEIAESVFGEGDVASGIAGLSRAPAGLISAPNTALLGLDAASEILPNVPGTVDRFGAKETAITGLELGGRGVEATNQAYQEDPAGFAGELAGEVLLGAGLFKATELGIGKYRSVRTERNADVVVDLEDVTSERGTRGELPEFETDTNAPTREAVEEVRERAADQPPEMQETFGDDLMFRSESEKLPSDLDVERGRYELPGLFMAPDLSPLRLKGVGQTRSIPKPRFGFPKVRGEGDQVTLFPGDRVKGMPDYAQGSRRIPDPEGEGTIPDPTTGGARFLDEEATPGTAYVRPTGSRSPELEAIAPPGTQYTALDETFAVRLPGGILRPGRTVPGSAYRRVDVDDPDGPTTPGIDGPDTVDATDVPETVITRPTDTPTDVTLGPPIVGPSDPFDLSETTSRRGNTTPRSTVRSTSTPGVTTSKPPSGPPSTTATPTGTVTETLPGLTPTSTPPTEPPTTPTPTGTVTETGTPTTPPPPPPTGGSSTPFMPPPPPTTPTPPADLPEFDLDADEDDEEFNPFGVRDTELTDFVDPLTGDVIETTDLF